MFKDELNKNAIIQLGDTVYIYQYTNRNKTKEFKDLEKIIVTNVIPRTKNSDDLMVTGIKEYIDNSGDIKQDKITGFVVYKKNGNFIETSEGIKYISFYIKNGVINPCLKKIKEIKTFYRIYQIFKLKDVAEFSVDISQDLLFINQEEIDLFMNNIHFNKNEWDLSGIKTEINKTKVLFKNYVIYINDKMYEDDNSKKELFSYMCKNSNSKNKVQYDFNKKFSLKSFEYEIEEINI